MKIKYSLLDRFRKLTNCEIDFLLYIARHQDEKGLVTGVYYRDVCKHAGICKQSFYAALRSLQKKGMITWTKNSEIDYDVQILENDFSYAGSYQEGYINLNRKVFRKKGFKILRANEKYLMMEFMKITHSSERSYQKDVEEFYKKYTKLLGVTKRVIRYYLHALKQFFYIGIKEGKYYITYKAPAFRQREERSEDSQYLGNQVKVLCNRYRIKQVQESEIIHVAGTLQQYRKAAKDHGYHILRILDMVVQKSLEEVKIKKLQPKYIHKLIRQVLDLEPLNA